MPRSATSGLGWHILSLILVFIAAILLFLVVLFNIPLPFDDSPSIDSARHRAWLLTIGPRAPAQASTFSGQPLLPHENGTPADLSRRDSPGWRIGFGICGWCEWSTGLTNEGDRDAYCVNHPFYHIPQDAPAGDQVVSLDLPYSIRGSLSIASFFLVLALVGAVTRLFILLMSLSDPPYEVQRRDGTVPIPKPNGLSHGTYHSMIARSLCLGLISTVFVLAWMLPTLIVVGIGVQSVRDHHPDLDAWFGWGSALVIAALVLLILSYLVNVAGGTYVNTRLPLVAAAKTSNSRR